MSNQQAHPAFKMLRRHAIDSLNVTIEEYEHINTGAQHIHIAADNPENVFLVALRTVPHDSTGVAHILEHTALCGSEKYPVRDPFFMMIRRSLNTFMNAFTSSDWTAYPFASQNRKDFSNLLDVYLDAVFFSRLDPLDFAQEGHRVEFETPDDPSTALVYKGVVFNEMKGAMSSVPSQLWQTLSKYLFPNNTYHFNSGGEPDCIPDLSYQELLAFYKTHYHPSNAIFMTYGDIPAEEHQARFEDQVLSRFQRLNTVISVEPAKRFNAPIAVEESYPLTEDGELTNKSHIVLGWLLGQSTNLEESLKAHLLGSILLDNSASPLQQALETSTLGTAPSPLCGLDDSQLELIFICGLEGSNPNQADDIEAMIFDVLEEVAKNGVDQADLEAALHQLELQQREVGGDGYPFGLQIILTALNSATHRGDPISLLDLDPALEKLQQEIKDPNFIKDLAKNLLLENQHRVRLTLKPDDKMADRQVAAEVARLHSRRESLSKDQQEAIVDQAKALVERQMQVDDDTILPKVGLEDIPEHLHYVHGQDSTANNLNLTQYSAGTNGLVYQQMIIKMPAMQESLYTLLPFYSICMTELGAGDKDYLETQRWQAGVIGSINAYSTIRGSVEDVQAIDAYFTLSAKALSRNQAAMTELMRTTFESVRFDELQRIRELVSQARARREQSVTGSGHSLALAAASAGMSPAAKLSHQLSGLGGIQAIKALDDALQSDEALRAFAQQLSDIHQLMITAPRQFLLVGEEERLASYQQVLDSQWRSPASSNNTAFTLKPVSANVKEAWLTNTQVNFCAKAYQTVPSDHPDAAVLSVLGGFLRNGYLHRAIREQGGAYGAGASQDNNIAAFRFYSYRDPRLSETLDDFDLSLQWLNDNDHEWQPIEEAILGVISAIDKPSSPAGEAKQTFHAELFGRTQTTRERFRNRVLQVKLDDLRRVANTYLKPELANIAVVTNAAASETVAALGLASITL